MTDITLAQPNAITADLTPFVDTARQLVSQSKSQRTMVAYQSHWREFTKFCQRVGASPLPASAETLVAFIANQAQAGRKPSTVAAQLAGVTWFHKLNGMSNPCSDVRVTTTLAGLRRTVGTRPTQKAPITQDVLRQLVAGIPDTLRGKRDKAILLIGMWGAFRRSELVALTVEDVTFTRTGAKILVRQSKTDQEGAGMTKQLVRLADSTICPVSALRDWLNAAQITAGALFRGITKHGTVYQTGMTGQEVARIVKHAGELAGMTKGELMKYAGHSLRAGFITEAAEKGALPWQISEQSGHKAGSRVLEQYIRAAGRGAISVIGMMATPASE